MLFVIAAVPAVEPTEDQIKNGEVENTQFALIYDMEDWKVRGVKFRYVPMLMCSCHRHPRKGMKDGCGLLIWHDTAKS